MNRQQFQKYLDRDIACPHCGTTDDTLVPQHRANRASGGSKTRNRPSNILVMCSEFNGRIEADSGSAALARKMGWKLESWQDPLEVPVFDGGYWYLLDDDFGRFVLLNYDEPA